MTARLWAATALWLGLSLIAGAAWGWPVFWWMVFGLTLALFCVFLVESVTKGERE